MEHRRIGQLAQVLQAEIAEVYLGSCFDQYESEPIRSRFSEVRLDLAASSKIGQDKARPQIQRGSP
jgi:hypothetical protein